MLSLEQKIEFLESRIARANSHWSFLFIVNLAVVGWVLTADTNIIQQDIYIFIFVLVLFYVFLFIALMRAQSEMIALEQDIVRDLKRFEHQSCFYAYLETPRFEHVKKTTLLVYWLGNMAVIAYLLIF